MKIKIISFIMLLFIAIPMHAWRIEGDILLLEKGDNIWDVTYSLTGDGTNWRKLWDSRLDTLIKDPKDAYPNMKFKLNTIMFTGDLDKRTNHVVVDSSLFLDEKFSLIESKLKHIQSNTVNSSAFVKVLTYFLAAVTSIITGIISSWGFESLKNRFNTNNHEG